MSGKKFVRHVSFRHSKLGKGRKKKQVWRRPTGRDNKMREQRVGKPAVVKIGYKNAKKERENFKTVRSLQDLEGLQKGEKVVVGNIGTRKKAEIVKKLEDMKIEIQNLNVKRFLKHLSVKGKKKSGTTAVSGNGGTKK